MPINRDEIVWDPPNEKNIVWDQAEIDGNKNIPSFKGSKASLLDSYIRGIMSPIEGQAQFLTHLLPKELVDKGNAFNNWLADKGIPLDRYPEGGIDQQISDQEVAYQQARKNAGREGFDWPKFAGELTSPANFTISKLFAPFKGANLAQKAVAGAAAGAVSGASTPVTSGNFAEEKANQALFGAAAGGAIPVVAEGISRVIRPKTSEEVKQLMKAGITPTPGQILGGHAKAYEEKARSLPIVGDAITSAQKRGIAQFNKAVVNRAIAPIGGKLPKDISTGREALNYADDAISSAYQKLLPNLKGKLDDQFVAEISNIERMAQSLPKEKADQLSKIINSEILDRFTEHGLATGVTLKEVESKLGQMASGYMRENNYDNRRLGGALREIQSSLRGMILRVNPKNGAELSKINSAYAKYLRAEKALSSVATDEGFFTPSQYVNAVKQMDESMRKNLFSKGKALDQNFANSAKSVLANKYPDSGTAGRIAANAATIYGSTILNPKMLLGAGAASLPYLPFLDKATAAMMTQRPSVFTPLAESIRGASPYLLPGVTESLLSAETDNERN